MTGVDRGGNPPKKTQLLLLLNLLLSGSRIRWINWTVTSDRTRCVTHLPSLLSANSVIMPNFFVCLLCPGQGTSTWLTLAFYSSGFHVCLAASVHSFLTCLLLTCVFFFSCSISISYLSRWGSTLHGLQHSQMTLWSAVRAVNSGRKIQRGEGKER